MMQPRFEKRSGSTPYGLVEQARFRAGFDFMRLRADVGELSEAIAEWWQEFSTADDLRRQDLMDQVRAEQRQGQKSTGPRVHQRAPAKRAVREPRPDESLDADGEAAEVGPELPPDSVAGDPPSAPRKRRRRRKPRAGGAGEGGGSGSGGGEGGRASAAD